MENSVTFDPSLEYGATFRFPVTWSYLNGTPIKRCTQSSPHGGAQAMPKSAGPVPAPRS